MASIIKRKTKYSVVYTYTDSNGAKRQKWETCGSHAEAKKRKAEIEHQLDTGVFIPPMCRHPIRFSGRICIPLWCQHMGPLYL